MSSKTSISFGGLNHGLQIGDNYGSIHADFYPERPETPPSPFSTVPFPRDPDFVRRDTLLDQIRDKRSVPGSRVALVGLGGVGKSQLAIEYSYQVRSESPTTWVFWVHASSEARFEQSFRDIADQLKLRGRQDKVNIFQLVEGWLRDGKKGTWICVLDNVDDDFVCSSPATLDNPTLKPLLEYIPRSAHGYTIITSRSREIALKMVNHDSIVEVKPMEKSEALELFQQRLGQSGQSQESPCLQLVEALDCMPLAIIQAAGYIKNRAPRCSVAQYLGDLQKSDRDATKLLKKEVGHIYRDWEAKNSILVTWQISFDHLRQTKQSAAKLLSLISFFDRQGIPESLIQHQCDASGASTSMPGLVDGSSSSDGETSESESDNGLDLDDDITTLRDYSFISVSEDGTLFTMHRLVQLSTRAWLKQQGELEQWREQSIMNLSKEFPLGEYENWELCRLLYPHVKYACALSWPPKSRDCLLEFAGLLFRAAWYAYGRGMIEDMVEMASMSRAYRIKLLGAEDEASLSSTALLTAGYREQGRIKEAELLAMQAMKICKELGSDHLASLDIMNQLAATYYSQDRLEEAMELFLQVMETHQETSLGDDPDRSISMHSVASCYFRLGRSVEAEQLEKQALEIRKTKFGEDHPATLESVANLYSMYYSLGRLEESAPLCLKVVEARKKKLGEDHPATLQSMFDLGSVYRAQERFEEAEKLFLYVVDGRRAKLGECHPHTIASMRSLAAIYDDKKQLEKAEDLELQILEICKTNLGEDHLDTLKSMHNLADTYNNQRRYDEAEKLLLKVLPSRSTKLGGEHLDTASSMNTLAITYYRQGRLVEANELFKKVMEIRKAKLGEDHPDLFFTMYYLALTWKSQGLDAEAFHLLQECFVRQKEILGSDHSDTLVCSAILLSWETDKLKIST